ncbi:hypothetical protein CEXT_17431 [Caerostris extrusa]|uniref:Uncharacterized protein n=1 Tax=Caerostris extrusa TaxID=172846 RepID=A0AAV4U2S9_CAEEX|nr:hypothetical protein CEXT_17431 [Caerostris extrusa]
MHYHAICFCPKASGEPISLAELAETFHFWKPDKNTRRMESSPPRAKDLAGAKNRVLPSFPRDSQSPPFFSSSRTTRHRNLAIHCFVGFYFIVFPWQ